MQYRKNQYEHDLRMVNEKIGKPVESFMGKTKDANLFCFGTKEHYATLTHLFNVHISSLFYQLEPANAKAIESNNGYWQIEEYHDGHSYLTPETVRPIVDSDPFPKMKEFLLRHGYIEQTEEE